MNALIEKGLSAIRSLTDREPSRFAAARQPNAPGFFKPPQQGHLLRAGSARGRSDHEPSRFAAARQPDAPGFSKPPQQGHLLRAGTARGPLCCGLQMVRIRVFK